jgi:hypothetical protein
MKVLASEAWGHVGVLYLGLAIMATGGAFRSRAIGRGQTDPPTMIIHALTVFIGFLLAFAMTLQLLQHAYGWDHG